MATPAGLALTHFNAAARHAALARATFRTVPRARPRALASAAYEAGAATRRTSRWHAPTLGPNDSVLYSLTSLRDRSRRALRDDGNAKGIIDTLVYNVVGYGIKPLSTAKDEPVRRAITAAWERWIGQSASDGRLGFYGQQMQAVRAWLEGGETFVILRPRRPEDQLAVPLQLQIIEPELCPHDWNAVARSGAKVRAGIEFSPIGNRLAYYFYRQRPGDLMDWDVGDLVRMETAQFGFERVLHLYDQQRPGQIRGVPILAQALIKLYELDKFGDAVLLRQQIGNLFAAFIRRAGTDGTDVNPVTGLAADATSAGRDVVSLEPGIVHELGPGEELQFAEPPDPPATYTGFMAQQLRAACAAAGTPYEVVTNDWAGLNDRIARVILHEFRRRVQVFQFSIVEHQVCRPVWQAWMWQAVLSGAIPVSASEYLADPLRYGSVTWVPHGWPYIHPVQDVTAAKEAIRCGLTSRSAVVSEQGEDSEAIDRQQQLDNARADELRLRYESDGRQGRSQTTPAPASGDAAGMGGEGEDDDERQARAAAPREA